MDGAQRQAQDELDAFAALERYRPYMAARLEEGVALPAMARHMLGLMHGRAGARAFRRILTVEGIRPGAGLEVLELLEGAVRLDEGPRHQGLAEVVRAVLRRPA